MSDKTVLAFLFFWISLALVWVGLALESYNTRRQRDELNSRIQVLEKKAMKGHDQPSEAGVSSKIGPLDTSSKEEKR